LRLPDEYFFFVELEVVEPEEEPRLDPEDEDPEDEEPDDEEESEEPLDDELDPPLDDDETVLDPSAL